MKSLVEEQYYLAKRVNISVWESNQLVGFEREAFSSLLIRDLHEEAQHLQD